MAGFALDRSGLLLPEHLLVPPSAAVYCDESGNTGANYLDPAQPFYVLAGWLVPDKRAVEVAVAVDRLLQAEFPRSAELKAGEALRNDRRKGKCAKLFSTMGRLGCVPTFVIAEKRYCLCGKVVETFMDPAYNAVVKGGFIADVTTKRELANALYDRLPDAVLNEFAAAYRSPTAVTLLAALQVVVAAVETHVSPELAKAIGGCETFLNAIAEAEADASPLGKVSTAINMPCLVSFLMLVQNLAAAGVAGPIVIYHDEQHAYQEGYEKVFRVHQGLEDWLGRPAGGRPDRRLTRFEMRESTGCLPIQAADLLAGTLQHCCRLATGSSAATAADRRLADMILPGLLSTEPRLSWLLCSARCRAALVARIFDRPVAGPDSADEVGRQTLAPVSAPLFPMGPGQESLGVPKMKFDLPIFGLTSGDGTPVTGSLPADDADEPGTRFVPLFTIKTDADRSQSAFTPAGGRTPSTRVQAFAAADVGRLVDFLRRAAERADYVAIDPSGEPLRLAPIDHVIGSLSAIWDRVRRAFASGLDSILFSRTTIGTREVFSMSCSDGSYAAHVLPDGVVHFGPTRDAAIAALRRVEDF